jgi:phosphoesterase RecJ-like protein
MTDTGHFLHANSSREALAIASEMLLRGASLPKIINKTTHNKSFATLKVWGRVLEKMKFNKETGLAAAALSAADLQELLTPAEKEANADLFGDIVSFLSYLSGVRVALLLREEQDCVKGSLRTNDDDIDVAQIAANWGGGGHKKAAGFVAKGWLKETASGWAIEKIEENSPIK